MITKTLAAVLLAAALLTLAGEWAFDTAGRAPSSLALGELWQRTDARSMGFVRATVTRYLPTGVWEFGLETVLSWRLWAVLAMLAGVTLGLGPLRARLRKQRRGLPA